MLGEDNQSNGSTDKPSSLGERGSARWREKIKDTDDGWLSYCNNEWYLCGGKRLKYAGDGGDWCGVCGDS